MGLVALRGRCGASARLLLSTVSLVLAATHAAPLAAATHNVPTDYPSVQAAVDAASTGDIVLLAPGTHQGGVFVDGKALRFASRYHITGDTSYIAQTVISGVAADMCTGRTDCQGGAVIEFGRNAHGSAIVGLTITNGTDGVRSRSMVDILYCRIIGTGDGTDYSGGGGGLFSNNLFANNRDDGIDLNGRVDVRIINNIIRDNRDDGIEFRLQHYSGAVLTTEITGNRITGNGEDGIQLIDYNGNSSRIVHIERNYFSNNADAAVGVMGNGNTVEDLSGSPMPERVRLYNNTFSAERNGFVGGANVIALNNIFSGTLASALRRVGGNSIASYNLFWNNGTHFEDSNIDQAHALIADPQLTSNGTLGSGSPAIDAGTAFFQWQGQTVLDLPASSYSENSPDLGAFESSGSSPPPLFISCAPPVTTSCPEVPNFPTPTVSGACSANPNLSFVDTTVPGTCPGRDTVTRVWTVTDACGRSATCSQTITVRDNTAPVFSGVGQSWTIECGTSPLFSEPTASDACDPTPTVTFVDVTTVGACPQSRVVTRTWRATDDCGNSATASQAITIQDRSAPTLLSSPASVTVSCPTVPEFGQPSFSDACDNSVTVTFTDETLPATCPVVSEVRRTWTAADDCGNSVHTSQTLTVRDQTPPAITGVDGPLVLECPATPQFGTPTVTDDCSGSPQLTWSDVTAPGACTGESAVTRTWIATDACGNTATATWTITILDRTPPTVVSSPANVTLSCPATPAFGSPEFSDACDNTPAVTFADQELTPTGPEIRRVTRTWTATDDCGNSAITSQTVTIEDHEPPVLDAAGSSTTLECPAGLQFTSPTATDACDAQPTVTFSDVTTPGACPQEYSVTRTWTATDDAGNRSAPVSQTLTVSDRTAPTITGVGAAGVVAGPATPQFGTPVAQDACDPDPALTHADVTSPGACAGEYTITRTWTATDACGNTSVPVSQSLQVEDRAAPMISGVEGPATLECPATLEFGQPTVSDASDPSPGLTFVDVTTPGSCVQSFTVTRTWTATDACGNSSTASRSLTVEDRTAPVLSGTGAAQTLTCPAVPAFETPTASDGCDPAPVVAFVDVTTAGPCPQAMSVTRTWTATDACGNSSTASTTITVEDHTPPQISGIESAILIRCPVTPAHAFPTVRDDCDPAPVVTFSDDGSAGACPGGFSLTRTWIATDACGNSSSASQTLTVLADSTVSNLVANPSFETDTEGWRGYGSPTLERIAGDLDGDYVLQVQGPNSTGRFGIIDQPRCVAVPAAGTRYRMSAWVRSDTHKGTMRIQVREYLANSREGMIYSNPLKLQTQWQLLTVDYVAASTGSTLDFMILNYPDKQSEQFLVDDISIVATPVSYAADVSDPEWSRVGSADSTAIGVTLYPTPFRSRGTLRFATATRGPLRVEILDVSGRRVRKLLDTPDAGPGVHRLAFDGRADAGQPLAPGVYFYRIEASARVTRGRFIIIQ